MKQFVLISYDISNDRRRSKVARTLEDYGRRVQYSVFECLLQPADLRRLNHALQPWVVDPQDSIRFYFISADDLSRIKVIGHGAVTNDEIFFLH